MRKLTCLVFLFIFTLTAGLWAQESKREPDEPYTVVGVYFPLLYFIEKKDSSENVGLRFKLPVKKDYGIEIGVSTFEIPIDSYSLGTVSYSGFGEEIYTNVYLDFIYYMPFYRYLQAKGGLDYYRYITGTIADNPTGINAGTLYTEQENSIENQFGFNIGAGLDVPLFEKFLVMTGIAYRFLFSDQQSTDFGILEFNIGLGLRL
jgi:hypothetical protein